MVSGQITSDASKKLVTPPSFNARNRFVLQLFPMPPLFWYHQLMEKTLSEQRDGLRRNGIRLTAIGELHRLPARLRSLLEDIQVDSSDSSGSSSSVDSGSGRIDGGDADAGVANGLPSISIPVAAAGGAGEAEGGLLGPGEGADAELEASTAGLPPTRNNGSGRGSDGSGSDGGRGDDGASRQTPSSITLTPTSTPAMPTPTPTMTLCLAISYGGRSELAAAARELAIEAAAGRLDPDGIDESALGRRLSTARLGIPDPDLVVRTSGESRLSNLLVWQSAYSELHVVGKAWPDFRRPDLLEAFRYEGGKGGPGGGV